MRNEGLSLIEVLVVTVIVAVLAAIILPVVSRAKEQSSKTSCVSNLRQLGIAMQLYEADHDGAGSEFSSKYLPPNGTNLQAHQRLDQRLFRCRNTPSQFVPSAIAHGYIRLWSIPAEDTASNFLKDFQTYGSQTVMYADMNHNPKDIPFTSPHYSYAGLGLTFGGSIVNRVGFGDWNLQSWWNPGEGVNE